jgi:hypothetical protein
VRRFLARSSLPAALVAVLSFGSGETAASEASPPAAAAKPEPRMSAAQIRRARQEANELGWILFPGIYRSYDQRTSGFEASLLYKGLGGVVGISGGKVSYAEVELALWFFSLGVGPRRNDAGGTDWQATWAIPILPIFPYGRWYATDDERKSEYGFMVKVPIWDFWNADDRHAGDDLDD